MLCIVKGSNTLYDAEHVNQKVVISMFCVAWQASLATLHGAVQHYSSIRDVIFAARGFTMSANTRKPPHCFNFLRQAEVLAKAGMTATAQFQDYADVFCQMVPFFWFDLWLFFQR